MTRLQPGPATLEFLIPFYGDEELVRQTVKSVLRQTDPLWTMTIVEDGQLGSGVQSWVAELGDHRIRYEANERTLGVAGNFQRCLELGEGSHVVFLGCDDRLDPSYVSHVRKAIAQHPGAAVIQPGVRVIDSDGSPVSPLADRMKARLNPARTGSVVLEGEPLMTSLMVGNWTYFPSLVWRRDSLAPVGFRPDLQVTLDLVALVRLILNGERLLVTRQIVFEYRRHRASASSIAAGSAERFVEERGVYEEFEQMARRHHWPRAARAARRHVTSRLHAALLAPRSVLTGDWKACGAYLRHALGT